MTTQLQLINIIIIIINIIITSPLNTVRAKKSRWIRLVVNGEQVEDTKIKTLFWWGKKKLDECFEDNIKINVKETAW